MKHRKSFYHHYHEGKAEVPCSFPAPPAEPKHRDCSHPRSQVRRWLMGISQAKNLHTFPQFSTQEMAPRLGWETLSPPAEEMLRNPELAKPTYHHRLPGSSGGCHSPVSQSSAAKWIFLSKRKKEEDFFVSNPVVAVFPMGSVNHFLLADRNNFSFRNGTFMFCGFSVYTHFATLCQHLLMNKYIIRLTENEILAEADWMFKSC